MSHYRQIREMNMQAAADREASLLERQHVTPVIDDGSFLVRSADSGKTYIVRPVAGGKATCTCKAGERGVLCKHVRACYEWAARQQAKAHNESKG